MHKYQKTTCIYIRSFHHLLSKLNSNRERVFSVSTALLCWTILFQYKLFTSCIQSMLSQYTILVQTPAHLDHRTDPTWELCQKNRRRGREEEIATNWEACGMLFLSLQLPFAVCCSLSRTKMPALVINAQIQVTTAISSYRTCAVKTNIHRMQSKKYNGALKSIFPWHITSCRSS